jgi:hypothetical protein
MPVAPDDEFLAVDPEWWAEKGKMPVYPDDDFSDRHA